MDPMSSESKSPEPGGGAPENAAPVPAQATLMERLRTTRVPLWTSVVLALAVLLVFAWKQIAVGAAERRLEAERQALTAQLAEERASLLLRAREAVARSSEANHLMFGTALAWAVRGELIRGNHDQIDQYFNELVRNERIRAVVLAAADGQIVLASDRKLQGGLLAQHFPGNAGEAPAVAVRDGVDGEKLLVLPIQGLTSRLGTVVLAYRPETGPLE